MGKIDRVLKIGDLANIPIAAVFYGTAAIAFYKWLEKQQVSPHTEVLLVGLVLTFAVGSVMLQIVDRVRGSSALKARQANVNPAQTNVAHPTVVQLEEMYRIFDGPMLRETEANVRARFDEIEPTEREAFLSRTITMLMVLSIYEMAWLNIFGSQLRALNQLNNRMLTHEELRHFYDEGAANLPQLYQNRTYESWLAFLRTSVLVRDEGDRIQITVRGREFLRYVVQSGYDQNAKLG